MNKYEKGYIYIVKSENNIWYIVQQVGKRTWVATAFAQLELDEEDRVVSGNGTVLPRELKAQVTRRYRDSEYDKAKFRACLFNILKYGEVL